MVQDRMKGGKPLGNEDGIALVTALVLGLLGMLMVAAVLFMVNSGTSLSGSQKRHQIALAVAYGGNDLFVREILPQNVGLTALSVGTYTGGLTFAAANSGNFLKKLTNAGQIDINDGVYPSDDPDGTITFTPLAGLPPGQPALTVNATVVGTTKGNTAAESDSGIETGYSQGTGGGGGDGGDLQHIPWLFQTRADGSVTKERARLGSLYVH